MYLINLQISDLHHLASQSLIKLNAWSQKWEGTSLCEWFPNLRDVRVEDTLPSHAFSILRDLPNGIVVNLKVDEKYHDISWEELGKTNWSGQLNIESTKGFPAASAFRLRCVAFRIKSCHLAINDWYDLISLGTIFLPVVSTLQLTVGLDFTKLPTLEFAWDLGLKMRKNFPRNTQLKVTAQLTDFNTDFWDQVRRGFQEIEVVGVADEFSEPSDSDEE